MAVATSKVCGYLSMSKEEAFNLMEILHEVKALVICYQSKPILQLAMIAGVQPDFNYFDLAQAHFIINPEMRHDLMTLTEEFLGYKLSPPKKGQSDLFGMDQDELILQGERPKLFINFIHSFVAK